MERDPTFFSFNFSVVNEGDGGMVVVGDAIIKNYKAHSLQGIKIGA